MYAFIVAQTSQQPFGVSHLHNLLNCLGAWIEMSNRRAHRTFLRHGRFQHAVSPIAQPLWMPNEDAQQDLPDDDDSAEGAGNHGPGLTAGMSKQAACQSAAIAVMVSATTSSHTSQ